MLRQHRLKSALAGGVCAMALATAAHAEMRTFNVPAGELQAALDSYARQSGVQLLYRVDLVNGVNSRGAQGTLSPDEALAMVLADTGLEIRRHESGAVAIVQSGEGGSAPQSASAAGDGADSGTVEALIVTAQKREEDIQDVPIAISAFTQEDLTRSQVAGGPDLMTQVPNMTFTKTNFTSYSIQIRGIGTQAISATTDPAVAVAFNNTPFITNRFFEQEFYDLQRVEVLRGPQGTLYGRNATAGVVNVISAKPKFLYEAKLSGDISNFNSSRVEGMINIPLVEDKAALRVAGAWTKREGFVTNLVTGDQTDGRNLWSGRVSLAVEPNDWFRADLIYEHFEEDDDRLRSGKQVCKRDPAPADIGGSPVPLITYPLQVGITYLSQGCLPASMYSPDSFQTPNGYALAYYGPAASLGSPVRQELDPYASRLQSRNLREIETHIKPEYEAQADLVELQLRFDLSNGLTLNSETAFARDSTFSFQDFNRFNTTPNVFVHDPSRPDIVSEDGVFCDPQIGCTDRLALADLATAQSQQFSQEFRLSSDFDGPFNFNLGANFLRYDTEVKYYVFVNSITAFKAGWSRGNLPGVGTVGEWVPGESDSAICFEKNRNSRQPDLVGYVWSDPNRVYDVNGCVYIDPNNIHNLNEQGRHYFLSKNPYSLLSYAVFGEAYYQLAENLKLTAGFRWTVDQKTAPQHPSWLLADESYGTQIRKVIEREWREPTGRLAIDWKPELGFTDETLVYGSYVRGYKAGGANPPPPVVVLYGFSETIRDALIADSLSHPESFEAEFVNAYEVGTKNTVLDGRMTFNLGAFYYDYQGYQISQIVNRSAVNLNFDAEVWGAELETDWRPLENLRLGLKLGYENTRMADGSQAIDFMDRTAGNPDWVLFKPFPPMPSNCVLPVWFVEFTLGSYNSSLCAAYFVGVDPLTQLPYVEDPQFRMTEGGDIIPINQSPLGGLDMTGYPGFDPDSAPNNGEGFAKDLSGNELPNAPHYTATLTADYTLPLPNEWLMTLHTDLYYQSEAWTRIFNTEGYDKLKAYTNVNLAAIFTNEDAGWNVMAYVKNVFDRDSITGAFLNSDDTGLTTNVFLTEPRLYGIRVTKHWNGGAPWGGWFAGGPNGRHPFRLELGGYYGEFNEDHEAFAPATVALFEPDFPYPSDVQEDIDWGSAGGVKLTWQPISATWSLSGGVRYGRASGKAEINVKQEIAGGAHDFTNTLGYVKYFDPTDAGMYRYADVNATNEETHAIVDFMVGKEFGLGAAVSTVSAGARYAHLGSLSSARLHARPDLYAPPANFFNIGVSMHRVHGELEAGREFEGGGVAADWELQWPLFGDPDDTGQLNLDLVLGGSILWGKQNVDIEGEVHGDYVAGIGSFRFPLLGLNGPGRHYVGTPYVTPISETRSESVTVPSANASLGLSYDIGRTTISGGYRFERFFDAIDGGIAEPEQFDRDISGAYFKVSIGFGS